MPDAERENMRGHRRIVPDEPIVEISLLQDVMLTGRIRDVSTSGATVEAVAVVEIGDRVSFGTTRGHVTRLFDGGFAVGFSRLIPFERFGTAYRL